MHEVTDAQQAEATTRRLTTLRGRIVSRQGRISREDRRTAYSMLLPTVAIVLAVALIPVLDTIYLSLHHSSVTATGGFAGLDNYTTLFKDPAFREALKNTSIFTVVSVSIELVVGLGVALVLNRRFRGRGLLRTAVLMPWAFPLVVAALLFRLMLQDQVGILSYVAHQVGLAHGPILSDPTSLMISLIVVDVWTSTPFMAVLLLAGLQTIPDDVLEAARVDGATAVQRFFRVTLPLLTPALLVGLLFRTLQAWSVYDLFWVMAQRQLDSLSTYVYESVRVSQLDFAPGAAAAVLIFASSILIALVYMKGLGHRGTEEA